MKYSPLVLMPIQLKYRVIFLEMYVFPRAGRPTNTITTGFFTMFAHDTTKHNHMCVCVKNDASQEENTKYVFLI